MEKTIIQLYQIVHTILLTKYLLSLCILRVDSQISLYIYRNGELIHSINDISIEADEYLNVSLPNFDNDTYNIIIKDGMKIILDENINI